MSNYDNLLKERERIYLQNFNKVKEQVLRSLYFLVFVFGVRISFLSTLIICMKHFSILIGLERCSFQATHWRRPFFCRAWSNFVYWAFLRRKNFKKNLQIFDWTYNEGFVINYLCRWLAHSASVCLRKAVSKGLSLYLCNFFYKLLNCIEPVGSSFKLYTYPPLPAINHLHVNLCFGQLFSAVFLLRGRDGKGT